MDERAELASPQPEDEIRAGDEEPRDRVARRIAEDDETPRVLRNRAEQAFVVRVAAHDAVEHDHVRGADDVRVDGDVDQAPLCPLLEAGFPREGARASSSYAGDSSRLVARAAPRFRSSIWISPTPPPTSSTVAPSTPRASTNSTMRRAVLSRPRLRYRSATRLGKARREEPVTAPGVAAACHRRKVHPRGLDPPRPGRLDLNGRHIGRRSSARL